MFPFNPGRILFSFFLLLSTIFVITGCKRENSFVANDPTQIAVIDLSGTDRRIIERLDSTLNEVQLPGTTEPFFSSVEFGPFNSEKMPETPNLFLLVSTATVKSDTALGRLFSKDVLSKADISDEAVFIKRESLFYDGQIVWFLVYNSNEGLQRFIVNRISSASATMMSTNINRIISRDGTGSRYDRELSAAITREWGIELKLPDGFEEVDSLRSGNALYRRGAGTKTEEWMLISEIKGVDSIAIDSVRDVVTGKLIRYQDGSQMKTVSSFNYLGRSGYYRGKWETSPYPMAGLFTARILKKGSRALYIEAGIYSPGRNKTSNLLRLEKLLRDL